MRWILPWLAIFVAYLAGCSGGVSPDAQRQFVEAQQAFDQAQTREDFLRAAALHEQIAQSGIESGAVYYNQGNALVRAGERARAIAAYRQAQRYRPADPLLEANLRSTLATSHASSRPLAEYILFWQNWLSYPAKFTWAFAFGAMTLALGIAALIWPKSAARPFAYVGIVLTLAMVVSAGYDWYRFEFQTHGVLTRETIARKGNATTYEPAFTAPLPELTEFRVVEQRSEWLRIRLDSGQEGWVPVTDAVVY